MQFTRNLTIAILLGLALLNSAMAHNLEAQIEVEGIDFVVQAFFEDGTEARDATAEVIALDGSVLSAGKTDSQGRFKFSNDLKEKVEVTVEDDSGHREVFPLSPAAIALAIKGEAAELEHTHGEGDHDHVHEHAGDDDHDHVDGDHDHGTDTEDRIVLNKEIGSSRINRIISGLGYVLGVTGILFYILGFKRKAGA